MSTLFSNSFFSVVDLWNCCDRIRCHRFVNAVNSEQAGIWNTVFKRRINSFRPDDDKLVLLTGLAR